MGGNRGFKNGGKEEKVTHTEVAKRVKAALLQFHLRENRVQRAAKHV